MIHSVLSSLFITAWITAVPVVCAITTPPPQTSVMKLVATPSSITDGFTKQLSINCSFMHVIGSRFGNVMSLILSKTATAQDTVVFFEVATITSFSNNVDVKHNTIGPDVTSAGHLAYDGESFLTLQWSNPSDDLEGNYKCEVYGLDLLGHPIADFVTTSVTKKPVDLAIVLQNMKYMQVKQDQLIAENSKLTVRLNSMEANQTSGSCYCKDLRLKQDQLIAENSKLTVRLNSMEANQTSVSSSCKDLQLKQNQLVAENSKMATNLNNLEANSSAVSKHLNNILIDNLKLAIQMDNQQNQTEILNEILTTYQNVTIPQITHELANYKSELAEIKSQKVNTTCPCGTTVRENQGKLEEITKRLNFTASALIDKTFHISPRNNVKNTYFLTHPMVMNIAVADATCQLLGGHLVKPGEYFRRIITDLSNITKSATDGKEDVVLGAMMDANGDWTLMSNGQIVHLTGLPWSSRYQNSQSKKCLFLSTAAGELERNDCVTGGMIVRFLCKAHDEDLLVI